MKKLFVLLVALCALLMIAGCGGNKSGGSAAGKGTPKDTLVVATGVEPATIDPGVSMDVWIVSYPCYDRLVTYKKGSTEVQPSVAESWQASADGLQWTFKLRKDVKFQDGTPLDAKAVKFTFDRILKLKKGPSDYFPTLKSVEVVDANTVKFIMDKPFSPFLYTLATNCGNLVNPKVMDKAKGDDMGSGYLAAATMGSGPYKLAEWNRGQNMKLVANENYWGKKPALKTVILQIIKDASGQRLQLEKGDVDIAKDIPMEQMTELAKNKDIVINQAPGLKVSYLYLNNGKAPFNDVKVRQAMNYAMDYKAILDGTIKGKGLKLGGPIPKGMWGYDESLKGYTTDIEKAKSLLQAAGKNGMTVKLSYANYESFWEAEALLIQNSLQKVGIKCELEKIAWATLREKLQNGDYEMALGTWMPDFGDPYQYMNCFYDSTMKGLPVYRDRYKNPAMDKYLSQALAVSDQGQRTAIYKNAQKLAIDDAAYVLLFQSDSMVPLRKNVKGYVFNPMLEGMFEFQDLSKE